MSNNIFYKLNPSKPIINGGATANYDPTGSGTILGRGVQFDTLEDGVQGKKTINDGPALTYFNQSLVNTVKIIKNSFSFLKGYDVNNPGSSGTYIHFFDSSGNIILGTTAPALSIFFPGNAQRSYNFEDNVSFINGLCISAVVLSSGGQYNGFSGSGLVTNIYYG